MLTTVYHIKHRTMSSSNNNDSLIRPSSAFHTITHVHQPHTPSKHHPHYHQQLQQQNRYYTSPPVNIIPRPSPIKDQETHATTSSVNLLNTSPSFNSSSFISPVPSSSSNAYQHSHYSHYPRQQQQQQQQQQNDHYFSSNKKQRWSVDISNKKTNTPSSM